MSTHVSGMASAMSPLSLFSHDVAHAYVSLRIIVCHRWSPLGPNTGMAARQEPGLLYVRALTVFSCQRRVVSAESEAQASDCLRSETLDASEEI